MLAMPPRKSTRGAGGGRRTRQRRDDLPTLSFEHSLASSQNIPYPQLLLPIRNQVYEARSGRAFPSGTDPLWDREMVFEGHIRAPFDERAQQLGQYTNQHCYEQNPLAGRGSTNESFLAADPLGPDGLEQDLENLSGQMTRPTTVDVLDPLGAASAAANMTLQNQALQVYLDPGQAENIKLQQKRADAQREWDKNILQSRGYDMVEDTRGETELTTRNGHAIPYFISDEIYELEGESDPISKTPVNYNFSTDYWINWFGYKTGEMKTPRVENKEELLHTGSEFLRFITGVDKIEQEFTMEHKGVYPDAEISPDHLSILAYESTPGNQEQSARDDDMELRARQLVN